MVVDIRARFLTIYGIRNLFVTQTIYCEVPVGIAKDPSSNFSFHRFFYIVSNLFDEMLLHRRSGESLRKSLFILHNTCCDNVVLCGSFIRILFI